MTLMGLFATWTMVTVKNNQDSYLYVDSYHMNALYALVGLTWAAWLMGVVGIIMNKGKKTTVVAG